MKYLHNRMKFPGGEGRPYHSIGTPEQDIIMTGEDSTKIGDNYRNSS